VYDGGSDDPATLTYTAWRRRPTMKSLRTSVQPAGAVKLGWSSLLTTAASITWPAPVSAGRASVILVREVEEPFDDDSPAVTPAEAGTAPPRVGLRRITVSRSAKRDRDKRLGSISHGSARRRRILA
jgi:hypothetical protein